MKAFVVLLALSSGFAVPIEDVENVQRIKKSYGAYAPAPCGGGTPLAPVALYLSPQASPIVSIPHYRKDEHEEMHQGLEPKMRSEHEMHPDHKMNSEQENMRPEQEMRSENEQARSYYGAASAPNGIVAPSSAVASVGAPAIGLFPNAKIGGCAVPLLLSCAPSVHSGHLAHAAAPGYAAVPLAHTYPAGPAIPAVPAYRTEAEHKMREKSEQQWAASARAMEPTSAEFEPHHHHMVAMDFHPTH